MRRSNVINLLGRLASTVAVPSQLQVAGPGPSSIALGLASQHARRGMGPLVIRQYAEQTQQSAGGGWGNKPPVSMQTLLLSLIAGAAGLSAVKAYKDQKVQQVMVQSQQVVGKAAVGGPFELIDYDGKKFTDKNMRGEFALLYFGFCHCPDICPDELEKVSAAVDIVDKKLGVKMVPVFISVDPERDTPARVKAYVKEFHPRMMGLTGDLESVKKTSKAYRVYYSKTGEPNAKDYLVDHSIIHYLVDPDGEFVTFYGKNYTEEQMADSLCEHAANWKAGHPDSYHPGKEIKFTPPKPPSK
uniref:Thioredoxin domain-containing protein n=1 Tax=Chlamydomonas leiostraca TaxID=1034604 RepID=A0A7S0WQF2_9CHLO